MVPEAEAAAAAAAGALSRDDPGMTMLGIEDGLRAKGASAGLGASVDRKEDYETYITNPFFLM